MAEKNKHVEQISSNNAHKSVCLTSFESLRIYVLKNFFRYGAAG